eukprot:5043830-Pyramimonas_sp.AAC.1
MREEHQEREPEGSDDQTPGSGSGQIWPSRSSTENHEEDNAAADLQKIKDRAAHIAASWVI